MGGSNASTGAAVVFYQDLVLCGAEPDRHFEARPGLWNARLQMQNLALQAQPEDALDAHALHPSRGARVPRPTAASDMARIRIDVGGDDVGLHFVALHTPSPPSVVYWV